MVNFPLRPTALPRGAVRVTLGKTSEQIRRGRHAIHSDGPSHSARCSSRGIGAAGAPARRRRCRPLPPLPDGGASGAGRPRRSPSPETRPRSRGLDAATAGLPAGRGAPRSGLLRGARRMRRSGPSPAATAGRADRGARRRAPTRRCPGGRYDARRSRGSSPPRLPTGRRRPSARSRRRAAYLRFARDLSRGRSWSRRRSIPRSAAGRCRRARPRCWRGSTPGRSPRCWPASSLPSPDYRRLIAEKARLEALAAIRLLGSRGAGRRRRCIPARAARGWPSSGPAGAARLRGADRRCRPAAASTPSCSRRSSASSATTASTTTASSAR